MRPARERGWGRRAPLLLVAGAALAVAAGYPDLTEPWPLEWHNLALLAALLSSAACLPFCVRSETVSYLASGILLLAGTATMFVWLATLFIYWQPLALPGLASAGCLLAAGILVLHEAPGNRAIGPQNPI